MGSWVVYGLGSESQDLPGFVVLASGNGTSGGTDNFASGFLPSTYAGTVLRSTGDPILYLSNPPDYSRARQRSRLDAIGDLNRMHYASTGDTEIESRIHAYELAFRMQASAPDLLDFSKESPATIADAARRDRRNYYPSAGRRPLVLAGFLRLYQRPSFPLGRCNFPSRRGTHRTLRGDRL
jgi:hypothetical protein